MAATDKEKKKIDTHFEAFNSKLIKYLGDGKESDVLVIKTHLICEKYLDQILIVQEKCTASELQDLGFRDKLDKTSLSSGDDFDKKVFQILNQLNKIRNRVGHELEYKVSESDVDSMGYVIGKKYIETKYRDNPNDHKKLLIYCLKTAVAFLSVTLEDLLKDGK